MAVHIYGHPADMESINKIAKKNNLLVIEDAAEAQGATINGKKCGTMSDVACFSFYGNKIITTGEGGMIVTDNEALAKEARKFKDLYHSDTKRFIHEKIGYNYRMTNLQAALGCGQMDHIDEYIKIKRFMAMMYNDLLANIPGIITPKEKSGFKSVFWMYAILVDSEKYGMSKDELRKKLKENGVDTRDFFYPPTDQPVLKNYLKKNDRFKVTKFISKRGLYLPSGLALRIQDIIQVANQIRKFTKN